MVVNLIPIQCLFEGLILNDQVNYIYLFVTEVGQMSQSCVGEGRVSKVNKAKKKKNKHGKHVDGACQWREQDNQSFAFWT